MTYRLLQTDRRRRPPDLVKQLRGGFIFLAKHRAPVRRDDARRHDQIIEELIMLYEAGLL